jgi:hypothetical protein
MTVSRVTTGITNIYISEDLLLLVSVCLRPYLCSVLMNFFRHATGRCLVKFSEVPTVIVGTDDTTFKLRSVKARDFAN